MLLCRRRSVRRVTYHPFISGILQKSLFCIDRSHTRDRHPHSYRPPKITTMTANHDDIASRPDWHLFYTELLHGRYCVSILIDGSALDLHSRYPFYPDAQSGTVRSMEKIHSKPQIIEEHGWFSNVDRFSHICKSQPVPPQLVPVIAGQHHRIFDAWMANLLSTLATEPGIIFDDGNTV
jgi:hypothetical protein